MRSGFGNSYGHDISSEGSSVRILKAILVGLGMAFLIIVVLRAEDKTAKPVDEQTSAPTTRLVNREVEDLKKTIDQLQAQIKQMAARAEIQQNVANYYLSEASACKAAQKPEEKK